MPSALPEYPVVVRQEVRWGDMDAFQHVNNTVFFQYFESARIEFFAKVGFTGTAAAGEVGPILAETACRFKRPVTYPDVLHVGVRAGEMGENRFTLYYAIFSEKLNAVVAEGTSVVVSYNYAGGHKTLVPEAVKTAIASL